MYTDADRDLSIAKENIQKAIEKLSKVVVDRCEGHDDFTEKYRIKICQSFYMLLKIRDTLNS